MSLLSAQKRELAHERARQWRTLRTEAARAAYWGVRDGEATQLPPGLKKLESPQEKELWMRFLSRQAIQEQNGMVESDIATTAINHPDVRAAMQGEVQP